VRPAVAPTASGDTIEMARRTIWDFWASRYEGLWAQRYSLAPTRQLVRARIAEVAPTGARLLDAGCGTGQLLAELAEERPDLALFGSDPSGAMIAQALTRHATPSIRLRIGTIDDEREGPFDLIVMTHSFPYVGDQRAAARQLFSLLKPGGRVLLAHANSESLYDRLFLRGVKLTTTRTHYPSARELVQLFTAAGFVCSVIRGVERPRWMVSLLLSEFTPAGAPAA